MSSLSLLTQKLPFCYSTFLYTQPPREASRVLIYAFSFLRLDTVKALDTRHCYTPSCHTSSLLLRPFLLHPLLPRPSRPTTFPSNDLPVQRPSRPTTFPSNDLPVQRSSRPTTFPSNNLPLLQHFPSINGATHNRQHVWPQTILHRDGQVPHQ
jgi:hypothetical protein